MAFLNTIDISQVGHKVLLYGPPKRAGKTLAAGNVAAHFPGRTIWLDLENGFKTLKQLPESIQAGINLIRIPDTRSNQLAIRAMDAATRKGMLVICDLHGRTGPVCVDCAKYSPKGEIQRIDFNAMTHEDLVVVDSATQLSSSALALAMKDEEDVTAKVEWEHWGKQGMLLDMVFVMMQQSRANWIVTSHNVDISKSDKKSKVVPQAGTRNYSANFAKYFDHVVYMDFYDNKFRQSSSVAKNTTILTGSRTNVDLEDGFSQGIITLMRTVKGTGSEAAAKTVLQNLSTTAAELASTAEETGTVGTTKENLKDEAPKKKLSLAEVMAKKKAAQGK